jgi:hypothetical protein
MPKRAGPAAKGCHRCVVFMHACKPPSPRTQLSDPRRLKRHSAAQSDEERKEIPGSHRTAPCCLSSQNQKSRVATASRSSSSPGHDPRGQLSSQAIYPTPPADGYRLSPHPGIRTGTGGGIRAREHTQNVPQPGPAAGFSTHTPPATYRRPRPPLGRLGGGR